MAYGAIVGPSRAFRLRLVAVALEHQVGDAPDVDLRDHPGRLPREGLYTVNPTVFGPPATNRPHAAGKSTSKAAETLGSFKPRYEILYRRLKLRSVRLVGP